MSVTPNEIPIRQIQTKIFEVILFSIIFFCILYFFLSIVIMMVEGDYIDAYYVVL